MDAPLFQIVPWWTACKPNPELSKIRWINHEVQAECLENDTPDFVTFGVISKQHLKA
jgi:hypothetical protein